VIERPGELVERGQDLRQIFAVRPLAAIA